MNLIIPLMTLISGCAQKGDFPSDEELADDLWAEIGEYQSWSQVTDWEGVVPSESVHGASVQIWLNESAFTALSNSEAIPDGGIIVKDGYNDLDGTDHKAITAMKKIDGYNSEAGDWFWAGYDIDGTVNTSGKADFCISCHASGDDYVVFTGLEAP